MLTSAYVEAKPFCQDIEGLLDMGEKYQDKWMAVIGKVESVVVSKETSGVTVQMSSDGVFLFATINFEMRSNYATKARSLKYGDAVVLGGLCQGKPFNVEFVHGVILDANSDAVKSVIKEAEKQRATKRAAKIESIQTDIIGTPRELAAIYDANEVAADNNLKGKIIELTGQIKDIGIDILGDPHITFSGVNFRDVQCFFIDDEEAGKIANLRKGQTVTVQGTVNGLMVNVLLKKCVFKQ
jgi:hypothetical protein